MTTVRLAMPSGGLQGEGRAVHKALSNPEDAPALLVSFIYLKGFLKHRHSYHFRDWMLDSGAFSAWNRGVHIDINEYIATCKEFAERDSKMTDCIALDVIGDDRASLANAHYMRRHGVTALPVFHIGDDWGILKEYCAVWDKVGLSCRFGESVKESLRFYDRCFALAWPHKFHSFGWVQRDMLMRYPFWSCDASSWELAPTAYGQWKSYGKASLRGSTQNLRVEVEYFLRLERDLRWRWRNEMKQLGVEDKAPTVRLAKVTERPC